MNTINKPGGVNPFSYNELGRSQVSSNTGASFSDVLTGALKDRSSQAIIDSISGSSGLGNLSGLGGLSGFDGLSGLSGQNMIPGFYMPSTTAGLENTMVSVAESGQMSGTQ